MSLKSGQVCNPYIVSVTNALSPPLSMATMTSGPLPIADSRSTPRIFIAFLKKDENNLGHDAG